MTEPSSEPTNPALDTRFPRHQSGGIQDPTSPLDDLPVSAGSLFAVLASQSNEQADHARDPRTHGVPYDSNADTYDRERFRELT